jgi:hypothetical protein
MFFYLPLNPDPNFLKCVQVSSSIWDLEQVGPEVTVSITFSQPFKPPRPVTAIALPCLRLVCEAVANNETDAVYMQ